MNLTYIESKAETTDPIPFLYFGSNPINMAEIYTIRVDLRITISRNEYYLDLENFI